MTEQESVLPIDEANELVLEHQGWAESVARSVARAWNLDWRLDGLDGAAMEALIFCSRRYDPERGVPFRGYARKRIHEASTEAARQSRGWRKSSSTKSENQAREVSIELFNVFPELRDGFVPAGDNEHDLRGAVRQLLAGASVIAAKQGLTSGQPDEVMEYKRMVQRMAELDPIHQLLLWRVYWEGLSMRAVASNWETDELNVIREHKVLLEFLHKSMSKTSPPKPPRVRPGLRKIAINLKRDNPKGVFQEFMEPSQ